MTRPPLSFSTGSFSTSRCGAAGTVATTTYGSVGRDGFQASVQSNLDAALFENLVSVLREISTQLWQDAIRALQQDDSQIARPQRLVRRDRALQEIVQLGNALDAGEAAATDDERQQPFAFVGVRFVVGLFEHLHDCGSQPQCVAKIFERDRVLTHPRHEVRVQSRAERDDQMIERQLLRLRQELRAKCHDFAFEVDLQNLARVQSSSFGHSPNRRDDVQRLDRAADDFREQRLEDHVVFQTDQRNLVLVTLAPEQALFEIHRRVHASEAASQNQDSFLVATHELPEAKDVNATTTK
ncbi:MAG: hypothetical protein FD138_128 [Planctomycetota bacterium]|nr:MAG: hypothetical protein FD138_128 [Planctomycetota bacterium]